MTGAAGCAPQTIVLIAEARWAYELSSSQVHPDILLKFGILPGKYSPATSKTLHCLSLLTETAISYPSLFQHCSAQHSQTSPDSCSHIHGTISNFSWLHGWGWTEQMPSLSKDDSSEVVKFAWVISNAWRSTGSNNSLWFRCCAFMM